MSIAVIIMAQRNVECIWPIQFFDKLHSYWKGSCTFIHFNQTRAWTYNLQCVPRLDCPLPVITFIIMAIIQTWLQCFIQPSYVLQHLFRSVDTHQGNWKPNLARSLNSQKVMEFWTWKVKDLMMIPKKVTHRKYILISFK